MILVNLGGFSLVLLCSVSKLVPQLIEIHFELIWENFFQVIEFDLIFLDGKLELFGVVSVHSSDICTKFHVC